MNKLGIFIILVIILVVGIFGFLFWRGNSFSGEILHLEVVGPTTAAMGDEITYTVNYKNTGNFTLQNPKLVFLLPDNSLTEDGITRLSLPAKDLQPGAQGSAQFKTRLLGKEGDVKTAQASLTYTPQNLSARYEADASFATSIETVPIALELGLSQKIESGKEMFFTVHYASGVDYPLENLSIKIDPLPNFTIESTMPNSLDNIEWKLTPVQKGQDGTVTIRGIAGAVAGSSMDFAAHLGMWIGGQFITIKDVTQSMEVSPSDMQISQQINGVDNYTAAPGQTLHYQIFFKNAGATPINGIFIKLQLVSSAFDFSTFKSTDGTMLQNGKITFTPAQQILASQEQGSVSFDINLKSNWTPLDNEKDNPLLKNLVNVSGTNQEFDTKITVNPIE